mmetsp:Transcript_32222/g.69261  ORF Transcript_32222/g.69261 Transcript_32222/m.69261 type:complete len:203 (-) Transcript_32222:326-934(-)|eukprot:CAMPEP_0183333948 /NCGR_PEP_ID=MMETSP0164_2-20130417/2696_1 /TAXON_ID=221442 /ORGANISM="Coccolithus pelagicus ssp braarudi, Strain PLY182g" /LENGTH=202 /DNA_ID=CAMNT_0025502989 /DNA_START=53 /DNA_END=661 /DNA_ORIENTATION=-
MSNNISLPSPRVPRLALAALHRVRNGHTSPRSQRPPIMLTRGGPVSESEPAHGTFLLQGGPVPPGRRVRRNAVVSVDDLSLLVMSGAAANVTSTALPSLIDQLPRAPVSEESTRILQSECSNTCAICLAEYHAGEMLACLPCGGLHKSHWSCLHMWLSSSLTCPMCRWSLPDGAACSDEELHALMRRGEEELERLCREAAPL